MVATCLAVAVKECGRLKLRMPKIDINTKLYIAAGGIGTVAIAYGVYKLFHYLQKEDNYFTNVKWRGGNIQRRILVLGLEGAGKTRLLQCFDRRSKPWILLPSPSPSFGVNVKSAGMSGIDYHFWDVCYDEDDNNWRGLVKSMDVLLWVVDSAKADQLLQVKEALHRCIEKVDKQEKEAKECDQARNSYGIPIVVVCTKQDWPGSITPGDISEVLQVDTFRKKHKVYVVGVQIPNLGNRIGLWRLFELISWADRKRYV